MHGKEVRPAAEGSSWLSVRAWKMRGWAQGASLVSGVGDRKDDEPVKLPSNFGAEESFTAPLEQRDSHQECSDHQHKRCSEISWLDPAV